MKDNGRLSVETADNLIAAIYEGLMPRTYQLAPPGTPGTSGGLITGYGFPSADAARMAHGMVVSAVRLLRYWHDAVLELLQLNEHDLSAVFIRELDTNEETEMRRIVTLWPEPNNPGGMNETDARTFLGMGLRYSESAEYRWVWGDNSIWKAGTLDDSDYEEILRQLIVPWWQRYEAGMKYRGPGIETGEVFFRLAPRLNGKPPWPFLVYQPEC